MLELPLTTLEEFKQRCLIKENDPTRVHFVVSKLTDHDDYLGLNCYSYIDPIHRKLEIGRMAYSSKLQNTTTATDSSFQLLSYAFDKLGYSRIQARLMVTNKRAYRYVERAGFSFEGTTRRDNIFGGHYIDLHIFSMLDYEWPATKKAMIGWLDPSNFDEQGKQKKPISVVR